MKNAAFFLMVLAAVLMVLPGVAMGQEGRDGMRGEFNPRQIMRLATELELREEQREAIREILTEGRQQVQPLRQQLQQESGRLRELMAGAERERVLEQLDVVLDLEARVKRQRAELMIEVRDVLDAEQRARLQELREERRDTLRERGGERKRQRMRGR